MTGDLSKEARDWVDDFNRAPPDPRNGPRIDPMKAILDMKDDKPW